jgi:hypothetical protein
MTTLTPSETSLRSLNHLDTLYENLTEENASAFTNVLNSTSGEPLVRLTSAAISRLTKDTIDPLYDTATDYRGLVCLLATMNNYDNYRKEEIDEMIKNVTEITQRHVLMTALDLYLVQMGKK